MSSAEQKQAKQELRVRMRSVLRDLTPERVAAASASIRERLMAADFWRLKAGNAVALFGGLRGEPDLLPLIPWLHERGMRAVFFAIEDGLLQPREVRDASDMVRGCFGIWEPDVKKCALVSAVDLSVILVPGLAFGRGERSRLGRGAGYYDKLFACEDVAALRVALCFDTQVFEHIPTEPHDARMDVIVTESA